MKKRSAQQEMGDRLFVDTPAAQPSTSPKDPMNALRFGLEILEYLAAKPKVTTRAAIAQALKISNSAVYRSMTILEKKGYVFRTGPDGAYLPTGKLTLFQSTAATHQKLLARARPVMETLCSDISQSCNLSIPAPPHMQVVVEQEAPGPYGISIPLGFKYNIPGSAPGLAYAAFSKSFDPLSSQISDGNVIRAQQWAQLKQAAEKAFDLGFAQAENPYLPEVVDLSCPVFDASQLVAVMTIPYIKSAGGISLAWCVAALQEATERLSKALLDDSRVA